jgi:ATP-binding cassette subfamily B protein
LSVAMAFSLFTLKVPADSQFAYLDSPAAFMIVILILAFTIFLSPYLSMIGGRIWADAAKEDNKRKRLFYFNFFDITGIERAKDIRIYNQKHIIDKSAADFFKYQFDVWKKCAQYNAKFNLLSTAVSYLSNGLIYLFVALKAFAGAFGVGGIVQYVGAITLFSRAVATFFTNIGELANNNAFMSKIIKFLDTPDKRRQGGTRSIEKRNDKKYTIEFKNVSFKYQGSENYALKNVSFKFNIGERHAVVGMNGSGKTTMIKLLCRLYEPTEGEITLNGVDIKEYDYDEYTALFGVVFQDFRLMPYPLAQNVAASVNYDEKKVREALTKCGFESRLADMPKGLETYLHPDFGGIGNGVELSGGEAQKVAIARALYKDAPFIILDEPTAALDPIAEFEIYSKFNEIAGDKTAVYISHRLSSCRFCDDIAVFHEGELIQRGSHDSLIKDECGKYHELWNAQAQYYAEKETVIL